VRGVAEADVLVRLVVLLRPQLRRLLLRQADLGGSLCPM